MRPRAQAANAGWLAAAWRAAASDNCTHHDKVVFVVAFHLLSFHDCFFFLRRAHADITLVKPATEIIVLHSEDRAKSRRPHWRVSFLHFARGNAAGQKCLER